MEVFDVPTIELLAGRLELSEETVRSWDKRGGIPPKSLARLAEAHGRSVNELSVQATSSVREVAAQNPEFTPKDDIKFSVVDVPVGPHWTLSERQAPYASSEAFRREHPDHAPSVLTLAHDHRETRYQVVPRFEVRASAGKGRGEFEEEPVGEVAFEVNWMRRHLGRSGRGFASIEVRGDSMQPTLLNGDEIIIDKHVDRVDVNGIYVIALRGDLLVKRIQRKLDGSLVVRSDNGAYEPETISAEQAEDFRVVGRMVWPRVR